MGAALEVLLLILVLIFAYLILQYLHIIQKAFLKLTLPSLSHRIKPVVFHKLNKNLYLLQLDHLVLLNQLIPIQLQVKIQFALLLF